MRPMLLAVLVALSFPAVAQSQQGKSAQYLKLVAAAVSGYSAGGPVYVVICQTAGEWKVIGVFATDAEAQAAATAAKPNTTRCNVEGPYTNDVGSPGADMGSMAYGGGCKKGPDSDCVGDSSVARVFIAPIAQIQSVTITYTLSDRRQVTEQFDPRKVEAIFFTMPAIDRMLIPYYVRVYGLNGAARRRQVLLDRYGVRDLSPARPQ